MQHTDKGSTLRVLLSVAALLLGGLGFAVPAAAQTCPTAYMTVYSYKTPGGLLAGKISPAPSGQSNFPATRYTYDSYGRLQKVETGYLASCPTSSSPSNWTGFQVGKTATYSYDANGHKALEQVTGFYNYSPGLTTNITQYSYDSYDRLACTAVRMNPSASLPASACTLSSQGSDGPDRITRNSYDSWSRLTQVQKALGTASQENYATYTYTADGLQQYITDADGNKSELTYDGFDRLAYWYFPSKTSAGSVDTSDYEAYGYDANGNRTSLRKRDGETITYQYDVLNRMSMKVVPTASEDVYYGYDLRGLMLYALFGSTSGAGITNTYDGFGRLTSTTSTMGGISRAVSEGHDNDGDRISVTFPDGNYFDYDYDGLDRLSDVRENGSTNVVSEGYSPYGMLSSETRGGVTSSYGYEPAEKPQTWTDNFPAPANDITTTLAYNPADAIKTKTLSNDSYDYTSYVDGTTNYSANGLNQYTSVAAASLTYDANGNLTSDGSTGYTYDAENRVVSASGAHTATLTYDPLGRLFQIVTPSATIQFLYDGDQMVAEYNGSGVLQRRYVHGPGADEPLLWYEGGAVSSSTRRSLQVNYQGSIDSVADSSGNMIGVDSYDEYGRPGPGNIGSFQYTGQVWLPELGIYYYKARMYDPRLGRFLQTDPIGYTDDLDLYAYVGNDPLDRTDPTGETCTTGNNGVATCQVDQWTDKNGNVTASKNFTPAQKKAVAAFNKAYTKTVNTLLKNSKVNAIVKGPNGKTTKVNAGKLANTLEKEVFNVDAKPGDMSSRTPMDTLPGETNIGPTGLRAPSGLYGISGESRSQLWGIAITHEGIHAGYPWADNMWAGRVDFEIGHQIPYDQAAEELLQ